MLSRHATRLVILSAIITAGVIAYGAILPAPCNAQGLGCSPSAGLKHAVADVGLVRAGLCSPSPACQIDKATDNMEVAEPYLNPCSVLVNRQRWSSNVLWIYSVGEDGLDGVAEIGWRKICTANGPQKRFFFGVSRVGIVNDDDYLDANLVPQTGATYEFTLEAKGNGRWIGKITGPGLGSGVEISKVLSGFNSGDNIQVGGENMFDVSDMGVVGHKDVRFRLVTGSVFTMINQAFDTADVPGRYSIIAAQNYFQVRSNIHTGPTPTPVIYTDHCATGWN